MVYITADYTPKASENPHRGNQEEGEKGDGDDGSDLFRRFFRNGPFGGDDFRREPSGRNSPGPASSSTRTVTSSPTIT